jgi:hypothetical protein
VFEAEEKISLDEARLLFPAHPDLTTVWRWCVRGYQGIHLEYMRNGRRVLTSREAVIRFTAAMRQADDARFAERRPRAPQPASRSRSARRRARDHDLATTLLHRANI